MRNRTTFERDVILKKYILTLIILTILLMNGCSKAMTIEDLPTITSSYGWRIHPISGEYKFHTGIDFYMEIGTPVYALMNSYIVSADDFNDGYGKQILVYNYNNTYIRFAHLSEINVTAGQYITAGELIGLSGATGNVTGPHLHLEYMVLDGSGNYVYENPLVLYGLKN